MPVDIWYDAIIYQSGTHFINGLWWHIILHYTIHHIMTSSPEPWDFRKSCCHLTKIHSWTSSTTIITRIYNTDSKVHGTNMGPIWGWQDPGGPHVGPMNFVIWEVSRFWSSTNSRDLSCSPTGVNIQTRVSGWIPSYLSEVLRQTKQLYKEYRTIHLRPERLLLHNMNILWLLLHRYMH